MSAPESCVPICEDPPVMISASGAVWSRICPHCEYQLFNVLGPTLTGVHMCDRDGVVYLVQWVSGGKVAG